MSFRDLSDTLGEEALPFSEVPEEEEAARVEVNAGENAQREPPIGEREHVEAERGTRGQDQQAAEGYEAQAAQGDDDNLFDGALASPRTRGRITSLLETPRGRAHGTRDTDSTFQALLIDSFQQALRGLSLNDASGGLRQARAPPSSMEDRRSLEAANPRMTPGTVAATPTGMPMAAIPSYGGVSFQTPQPGWSSRGAGSPLPGAFYSPFQPPVTPTSGWSAHGTRPAWTSAPVASEAPTSATWEAGGRHATTGGEFRGNAGTRVPSYDDRQSGRNPTSSGLPYEPMAYPIGGQDGRYGTATVGNCSYRNAPNIGIPTELRNAVKVIVPFYSDTATSERAAAFWRSYEKCTYGMDDQMRLTAFEQCLKGKVDQEWWYNSRIDSFETLRVCFHNRFIRQTSTQLWKRLKVAKRNRGESAEEWGDRIMTICEALNYPEPRMQFEFFMDGLRNTQMRAVLNGSMVASIPEACALLLYKNQHLPVEEEDEFAEEGTESTSATAQASTHSQVLQQLQLMSQIMLNNQQGSGTQLGHINVVAPSVPQAPQASSVPASNGNASLGPLNIRQGPDTRTTEGEIPLPPERPSNEGGKREGKKEVKIAVEPKRALGSSKETSERARSALTASVTVGSEQENVGSSRNEQGQGSESTDGATERSTVTLIGSVEATERCTLSKGKVDGTTTQSRGTPGVRETKKVCFAEAEEATEDIRTIEEATGAIESNVDEAASIKARQAVAAVGIGNDEDKVTVAGKEEKEGHSEIINSASRYDRLLSDKELDMLELGEDSGVKSDFEEYAKELEDRLFPLDDERILERAKRNAAGLGKPTLADMSVTLGIPEAVLERTRAVSTGDMGMPEYWPNWYADALEKSTVAKRANRDFKEVQARGSQLPTVNVVAVSEGKLDEATIPVSRDCEDSGGTLPSRWRAGARRLVYELVKQDWDAKRSLPSKTTEPPRERGGEGEDDPRRDAATGNVLDEGALRGHLYGVTGHGVRVSGVIDLPVTLGTLEKTLPFVVTDRLFVDAILGTDTLRAFRAVIDLEEQTMTLKETSHWARQGSKRPSQPQTLCTVSEGSVLVEVCNASTEEVEIKSGTYVASVTIVPESAFVASVPESDGARESLDDVLSRSTGHATGPSGTIEAEMASATNDKDEDDFVVDFQDSSLGAEQRRFFAEMLKGTRDLFVETSKKPGRTELLQFHIDTGTHTPIKQPPYQVSKAEGDVMESET
ncbi:hypothetical protein PInf_004052 [Phytophthora infestans]|nr:hypothetical protein PInf_004052 [Phytophthora infestans]